MDRLTLSAWPGRYTETYLRRAITRHRFNLTHGAIEGYLSMYLYLCSCIYTHNGPSYTHNSVLTLSAALCRYTEAYLRRAITRHRLNLSQGAIKDCIFLYLYLCICIYTHNGPSHAACFTLQTHQGIPATRHHTSSAQSTPEHGQGLYISVSRSMYMCIYTRNGLSRAVCVTL